MDRACTCYWDNSPSPWHVAEVPAVGHFLIPWRDDNFNNLYISCLRAVSRRHVEASSVIFIEIYSFRISCLIRLMILWLFQRSYTLFLIGKQNPMDESSSHTLNIYSWLHIDFVSMRRHFNYRMISMSTIINVQLRNQELRIRMNLSSESYLNRSA